MTTKSATAGATAAPASNPVQTVEKPTVGRIVLVNIATFNDAPIWRPAIVVGHPVFDAPADGVSVEVFVKPTDHPLQSGLGIKQVETGTPSYPRYTGWHKELCRYGEGSGCWTWPTRADEPETFEV